MDYLFQSHAMPSGRVGQLPKTSPRILSDRLNLGLTASAMTTPHSGIGRMLNSPLGAVSTGGTFL